MIIGILGGIGSGKSVSATRNIVRRNCPVFVNYNVNHPKVTRLKKEHIILDDVIGHKQNGTEIIKKKLNWDFWNEHKHEGYDICLDEVHNLVHSRMAMTKNNVLLTQWISQIRKILGENENHHIWLISQRIERIDVAFRDLMMKIIHCEKIQLPTKIPTKVRRKGKILTKMVQITFIVQYEFTGIDCVKMYQFWLENRRLAKRMRLYKKRLFLANPYFRHYDSYEIINFGEDAYL